MFPRAAHGICFPTREQTLLLRAALLDGDRARAAFEAWGAAVDPDALDEGSVRLLPLLARRLLALGVADPRLGTWKGLYRRAFVLNELLFREAAAPLRALEAAGIPALLLKGAALVAGAYGDSGLRPMGDLDVLVPPERARDAFAALATAGFRSRAPDPERLLGVRHGAPFVAAGGRELDLHWHLLWENCAPGADAPLWAAAVEGRLGALAVRAPCAADQLLHVCVHGLQWSPQPQIRWAADAFLLASAPGAVDWRRLVAETERRRVALPVRTALRLVREELDAPVPGAALAALDALPVAPEERRELDAKLRPMRGLASLRVYWAHHRRAAAARGAGPVATLARFGPYLQKSFGVPRLAELPYFMLVRGLRRLWIDAGLGEVTAGETAGRRAS